MKINCREAEEMVNGYMNHTLSSREAKALLDHVAGCPSCYNELETHFIVREVTQQLNDQEDRNLDFKQLLYTEMRRSYREILIEQFWHLVAIMGMLFFGGALLVLLTSIILQTI